MKKILAALLAVTAIFACVSCSDKTETGETDAPAETSASTTDAAAEKTTKAASDPKKKDETDGDEKKDGADESSGVSVSDSDMKKMVETVQNVSKASKDRDMAKILSGFFPDELVRCIGKVGGDDLLSEGMFYEIDENVDISSIKIDETEDVDSEIVDAIGKYYNSFIHSFKVLEEKGYDLKKMDSGEYSDKEISEIYDIMSSVQLEDADSIEKIVDITDVKLVTLSGSGYMDDEVVYMYNVKGEGWKVDCLVASMLGYVAQSKDHAARSAAATVFKAASAASIELEETGKEIIGSCIIGSDSSKSVTGGSNADADEVREIMERYLDKSDKYEYFAVIDKGICVYAAVEKNGRVGTYPVDSLITSLGTDREYEQINASGCTLGELYEKCAKLVK